MPVKKKAEQPDIQEVHIVSVDVGLADIVIRGTTPLIMNRLSEKVRQELLLPSPPKNRAERAQVLKHNPHEEFQAAAYRLRGGNAPTLLGMPAGAFKRAIADAAKDQPGSSGAQIGRLLYVSATEWQNLIPIYGEPQLYMAVVKQAGQTKAPDIRTRVIVPEWAAKIRIEFVTPNLRELPVMRLISAAGLTIGVGDNRPEKGHDSFGRWEIATGDDQAEEIISIWGRNAQIAAMQSPTTYDDETEELLSWFDDEVKRRGFKIAS